MKKQKQEDEIKISHENMETAKRMVEHDESYDVETNITKDAKVWQMIADYYDSELFYIPFTINRGG